MAGELVLSQLAAAVSTAITTVKNSGWSVYNKLVLAVVPVTTNTATIGSDVYEFVTAAGTTALDANIAVEIGTAQVTLNNLIAAINGTAANPHAGISKPGGGFAVGVGTTNIKAFDTGGVGLIIVPAASPGGAVVAAGVSPNLPCSETITDAGDVWLETNMNLQNGAAPYESAQSVVTVTLSAAEEAAHKALRVLPFVANTGIVLGARTAGGTYIPLATVVTAVAPIIGLKALVLETIDVAVTAGDSIYVLCIE